MLVSVKEATVNDAEVISKLSVETFVETYAWYNTPENMREYTEKYFSIEFVIPKRAPSPTFQCPCWYCKTCVISCTKCRFQLAAYFEKSV